MVKNVHMKVGDIVIAHYSSMSTPDMIGVILVLPMTTGDAMLIFGRDAYSDSRSNKPILVNTGCKDLAFISGQPVNMTLNEFMDMLEKEQKEKSKNGK